MATTTFCTIGGVMVAENRGGVYTEYVPDPLGSLIQCKNASGTVTFEAEYYPYGEVEKETGSKQNDWGFVGCLGYLRDTAARLYVRARYYQVQLGRWLTVDPLWPEESAYGYVRSSPLVRADPSGLGLDQGCFWRLLLQGVSPFGACTRCLAGSGNPQLDCRGLPTRPVPPLVRKQLEELFAGCRGQASDCCVYISTEFLRSLALVGLNSEIPSGAAASCVCNCESAIAQSQSGYALKSGSELREQDVLAGLMACLKKNPNDPGELGWIKAMLEVLHATM